MIYIDNKVRVTSLSNGFPPIFAILHTIKEIHSFSWKKSLHKSILIEGLMIRVAIDHPFVSSFFIKTQVFTDCVFITQMTKCSPVVVYLFLLTCFFWLFLKNSRNFLSSNLLEYFGISSNLLECFGIILKHLGIFN